MMTALRIFQSLIIFQIIPFLTTSVAAFSVPQQQLKSHHASFSVADGKDASIISSVDFLSTRPYQNTYRINRRCSTTKLHMGWGPEPVWSPASIASITDACPSGKSVLIELSVPSETYAAYTIPGQYVQVKPAGGDDESIQPAFLAICSGPTSSDDTGPSSAFQFLVKRTGNNEWLTDATTGTAIQVSQVLGNGYSIVENIDGLKYDFPTQNILLFAAGSGIAPIAAAISSGMLNTSNRSCRLYYGERTSADLCFVEQFIQWENQGIEVVPVLSQPDDDWNGRCGYVQTALSEDGIPIPRNTGALLCGMKGMTESVKELLLSAGVFDGRVLFNF